MKPNVKRRNCNGPCGRSLPLTEFRLRRHGVDTGKKSARHALCRDCRNAFVREKTLKKRKRELSHDLLREILQAGSFNRVDDVIAGMLTRFGGLDGFVTAWWETIEFAKRQGRYGIGFVMRSYFALARMVEFNDRHTEPHELDYDTMSEDELQAGLEASIRDALEKRVPQMLASGEVNAVQLVSEMGCERQLLEALDPVGLSGAIREMVADGSLSVDDVIEQPASV